MSDYNEWQKIHAKNAERSRKAHEDLFASNKRVIDKISGNKNSGPNSYGSGSCFKGDTPILTPIGWQKIAELSAGDSVLSFSKSGNCLVPRSITKKKSAGIGKIWKLKLANGREVHTTRWHTFLTEEGWRFAWQIGENSNLVTVDRDTRIDTSPILSSTRTKEQAAVYNLTTEGERNFVANGLVAHNFSFARRLRSFEFFDSFPQSLGPIST